MAEVILRNISKVYEGGQKAVNNVNLEVKDKEFVVLVGPSGCGKSTTLRMIAGLEEISSGELYIDGKMVNSISPKDRDIAMVFQNYALYPHMTVFDNIAFGLKIRKYSRAEISERVNEAARILDIEKLLSRKPKALSGGQRQRVAVGRAIVRRPKVFLFDEPLSNLDAKLRVQMRTEISKLHSTLGATMIYVTHDQTEAMTMGDRIVVMKDGFVQQTDTPLNLYNTPVNKFVAGFIGSPSMNFIEGTVTENNGLSFKDQEGNFSIPVPANKRDKLKGCIGSKVILGVRPEDITECAPDGENCIKVRIDVVEPMGNETLLYFTVSGSQIIARVPPREKLAAGTDLTVKFKMDKLHFFDAQTESVL